MKKILIAALFGAFSLLGSEGSNIELNPLNQPLLEHRESTGSLNEKSFLQKYPSMRDLALYTGAVIVHIGSLVMTTQPCFHDAQCIADASIWLSLAPTLSNIGGTAIHLWDERKKVLQEKLQMRRINGDENV